MKSNPVLKPFSGKSAPAHVPIFEGQPRTWRELQSLVALTFREMGCSAEVEKSVTTARGTVNIDVLVNDANARPMITYVCECKLWNRRAFQNVVHGFRTVVGDTGADVGLIISSKGFQRGALAAAENTNVRLLTWEEFQRTFEERWTQSKIREVGLRG